MNEVHGMRQISCVWKAFLCAPPFWKSVEERRSHGPFCVRCWRRRAQESGCNFTQKLSHWNEYIVCAGFWGFSQYWSMQTPHISRLLLGARISLLSCVWHRKFLLLPRSLNGYQVTCRSSHARILPALKVTFLGERAREAQSRLGNSREKFISARVLIKLYLCLVFIFISPQITISHTIQNNYNCQLISYGTIHLIDI